MLCSEPHESGAERDDRCVAPDPSVVPGNAASNWFDSKIEEFDPIAVPEGRRYTLFQRPKGSGRPHRGAPMGEIHSIALELLIASSVLIVAAVSTMGCFAKLILTVDWPKRAWRNDD
jgi:hypothetical protein